MKDKAMMLRKKYKTGVAPSSVSLSNLASTLKNLWNNVGDAERRIAKALKAARKSERAISKTESSLGGICDGSNANIFNIYGKVDGAATTLASLVHETLPRLLKCEEYTIDAVWMLFDGITALSKSVQAFFVLGCRSVAHNRAVVREIRSRLQGAAEGELSELAQHELEKVLVQLKEQAYALERIDRLERENGDLKRAVAALMMDNEGRAADTERRLAAIEASLGGRFFSA